MECYCLRPPNCSLACVTLWNVGDDAYKPSVFGDTITIERKITAAGHTVWALKDHLGRKAVDKAKKEDASNNALQAVDKAKKEDVDDITNHFNINAGNPVQCLTQDNAKTFAGCTDGKAKYNLYFEATGFEQIINELQKAKNEVSSMKDNLTEMRTSVEGLEAKTKEVNDRLEALAEVETWQEERGSVECALAWAPVRDLRALLEKSRHYIEVEGAREQQQVEAGITELEGELTVAKEAEKKAKEELEASRRDYDGQFARQEVLTADQKDAKAKLQAAKREATRAARQLEEAERRCGTLRGTFAELEAQMASSTEDAEVEHAAALKDARTALEGAETTAKMAANALREAEAAQTARANASHAKESVAKAVKHRVDELTSELWRLQNTNSDPISKFGGSNMRALHDLVQRNQRRFKRPPLGPLGALLSVKEERWAAAIEAALKRHTLEAWIVDNRADQRLLMELARQARVPQLQSICLPFDHPRHNIEAKPQAPEHVLTVLRALVLPDAPHAHVLFNALVDHGHVERLALVQDEGEGLALVRGPHMREGKITAAWAVNGWHGYRKGNSETAIPNSQRLSYRLSKDTQAVLAQVQADLAREQQLDAQAREELNSARHEERTAKQAVAAAKLEKQLAEKAQRDADAALADLLSRVPVNNDGAGLGELQGQIVEQEEDVERRLRPVDESAKAKVVEAEAAVATAKAAQQAHHANVTHCEARMDACAEAQATAMKAVKEVEGSVRELNERRMAVLTQITKLTERMDADKVSLRQATDLAAQVCSAEEAGAAQKALVASWRDGHGRRAEVVARDPAPLLTVDALHKHLQDLDQKIWRAEAAAGGNLEQTKLEAAGLNQRLVLAKNELRSLADAHARLEDSHRERSQCNEQIMKATLNLLNSKFHENMRQRSGVGRISINYERLSLDMKVRTGRGAAEVSDLKAISGGERSYVTAAFITALAQIIDAPFYCLDEIDVYLDLANRGKTLEMLIWYAAQHWNAQYIMLTPLDVNAIGGAHGRVEEKLPEIRSVKDFVVTKRMPNPRH